MKKLIMLSSRRWNRCGNSQNRSKFFQRNSRLAQNGFQSSLFDNSVAGDRHPPFHQCFMPENDMAAPIVMMHHESQLAKRLDDLLAGKLWHSGHQTSTSSSVIGNGTGRPSISRLSM